MKLFRKKKKIVTHSGPFHPDDVFAVAVLDMILEGKYDLTRTRNEKIIEKGDYVVDVGGVYDTHTNRFDHHQKGGAGVRVNGIPYSSIGLVWKKFGEELCSSVEVARDIDDRLVMQADALDNGVDLFEPTVDSVVPYSLYHFIMSLRPAWNEKGRTFDQGFRGAVEFAKTVLQREILQSKAKMQAHERVLAAYQNASDKRIIVMDQYYPSGDVLRNYKEPLFIVHPDEQTSRFVARSFRDNADSFESRKLFPEDWAGKRDGELAEASGVPDAAFCHNERFIAIALSKEGAIELARKAAAV